MITMSIPAIDTIATVAVVSVVVAEVAFVEERVLPGSHFPTVVTVCILESSERIYKHATIDIELTKTSVERSAHDKFQCYYHRILRS